MKECKDCDKSEDHNGIFVCGNPKPHLCEHIQGSKGKTVIVVIGVGQDLVGLSERIAEAHAECNVILTNQHMPCGLPTHKERLSEALELGNLRIPEMNLLIDEKPSKHKNRKKNSWENPNKYHN